MRTTSTLKDAESPFYSPFSPCLTGSGSIALGMQIQAHSLLLKNTLTSAVFPIRYRHCKNSLGPGNEVLMNQKGRENCGSLQVINPESRPCISLAPFYGANRKKGRGGRISEQMVSKYLKCLSSPGRMTLITDSEFVFLLPTRLWQSTQNSQTGLYFLKAVNNSSPKGEKKKKKTSKQIRGD